jgi:adenylosuccinate synthase
MSKLQVVVDGQLGSCGKGAVAAHLAREERKAGRQVAAVRVGGPNAGHTAVDDAGVRWALRQIPVAAVANSDAKLYIAAGSEVDMDVLCDEAERLEAAGHRVYDRLVVDRMATVLVERHRQQERAFSLNERVGSTTKGIGAARAERIWRTATVIRDLAAGTATDPADSRIERFAVGDTAPMLRANLAQGETVQLECSQGYGLGLHHSNYPQTTSSDCRAIDFLSMSGLSPWDSAVTELEIWVTMRPRPIRVAGNSGPLHGETTWEALGLPEELTTVTKLRRRVGAWDPKLARDAIAANGGSGHNPAVKIALMMVDHVDPLLAGATDASQLTDKAIEFIHMVQRDTSGTVRLVGTSDRTAIRLR